MIVLYVQSTMNEHSRDSLEKDHQKALDIALSLKSAIKHSYEILNNSTKGNGENVPVYELDDSKKNPCVCCAGNHSTKVRQFIDKECFYCQNKGHTTKVCRKKTRTEFKMDSQQINLVKKEEQSFQSDEDLHNIFQVSKPKPTPLL